MSTPAGVTWDLDGGNWSAIPNSLIRDPDLSAGAVRLWALLRSYDWRGEGCWPSKSAMAEAAGVTPRTLYAYQEELVRAGYLQVQQRGVRTTNVYVLKTPDRKSASDPDRQLASDPDRKSASDEEHSVEEHEEQQGEVSPSIIDEKRRSVAVRGVFDYWASLYMERAVFDNKRAARIGARLDERVNAGASMAEAESDLKVALDNAKLDPWLAGERDGSPGYLKKLDTLLRDAAQVERLLDLKGEEEPDDFDPEADEKADLIALHGREYLGIEDDDPPAA